MSLLTTIVTGLLSGLSLIVAIGAQNAFVLRQGLIRRHVGPVVLVCAASDAVLIVAGVAGIGAVIRHAPVTLTVVRWVGAVFLFGYAAWALRRAWRARAGLNAEAGVAASLRATLLTCLALTWLNPHVYLDTVLLLGSLAQNTGNRWLFAAGAIVASVAWFSALGYGSRFARPLLQRPAAWVVLDGVIAAVMILLAVRLVTS